MYFTNYYVYVYQVPRDQERIDNREIFVSLFHNLHLL